MCLIEALYYAEWLAQLLPQRYFMTRRQRKRESKVSIYMHHTHNTQSSSLIGPDEADVSKDQMDQYGATGGPVQVIPGAAASLERSARGWC